MKELQQLAQELDNIYEDNIENRDKANLSDAQFQITEAHERMGKKLQHLREEDSYSVTQRKALFLGQIMMAQNLMAEGEE